MNICGYKIANIKRPMFRTKVFDVWSGTLRKLGELCDDGGKKLLVKCALTKIIRQNAANECNEFLTEFDIFL